MRPDGSQSRPNRAGANRPDFGAQVAPDAAGLSLRRRALRLGAAPLGLAREVATARREIALFTRADQGRRSEAPSEDPGMSSADQHERAVANSLSLATAAAAGGDFEEALSWLGVVAE
jgi:hypothetical protein